MLSNSNQIAANCTNPQRLNQKRADAIPDEISLIFQTTYLWVLPSHMLSNSNGFGASVPTLKKGNQKRDEAIPDKFG